MIDQGIRLGLRKAVSHDDAGRTIVHCTSLVRAQEAWNTESTKGANGFVLFVHFCVPVIPS